MSDLRVPRNSHPSVGWIGGEGWAYLSFPGAGDEYLRFGGWAMDRPTTEQLIRDLQEALDRMGADHES